LELHYTISQDMPTSTLTSDIIGTLFWVTIRNISCGNWRLHLVLRAQFSQWRSGPRSCIILWAQLPFLPVFWSVVFAPCVSFHVCSPSRCWLYMICCTAVRGIFAWFFACDAHFFTRVHSSERASTLTYDIRHTTYDIRHTTYERASMTYDIRHTAQSSPAPLIFPHFHRVALRDPEPLRMSLGNYIDVLSLDIYIGGGEVLIWGCSSWDTSARIVDTFSSLCKPSASRILSMLSSPSVLSRMDAWQYYQNYYWHPQVTEI